MIHYLTRISNWIWNDKIPNHSQLCKYILLLQFFAIRPTIHSYIWRRRRTSCHKGFGEANSKWRARCSKMGVESSSNNDSPPHRHRLQTRCFWVGLGIFILLLRWRVARRLWGHGGKTTNCGSRKPKHSNLLCLSLKIAPSSRSKCWHQAHHLALLPTAITKILNFESRGFSMVLPP